MALRILVTGSNGLLGSSLVPLLRSRGHTVELHTRADPATHRADLERTAATRDLLDAVAPEIIVNLVGLTSVDLCETEPNRAYRANVRVVENIAGWVTAFGRGCHLIHLSTDQLYDGPGPHEEDDVTLTNYYAFSKYAGELAASAAEATILRTNFFGRSRAAGRLSLTDWLYAGLTRQEPLSVFEDVQFSALSTATVAEMIELTARVRPSGTYNVGAAAGMSKAQFAFRFAEAVGLPTGTLRASTSAAATFLKAYRPKDMRMDSARFERAVGTRLPDLRSEVLRAAGDYCERR